MVVDLVECRWIVDGEGRMGVLTVQALLISVNPGRLVSDVSSMQDEDFTLSSN